MWVGYISVVSNLLTSSRISSNLQVKIKRYVKTSGPPNGGSVYISVVTNLLTSSRISSTLQVKIKRYIKASGPPNGGLVYISVVTDLLTSSRISSTLRVKIKIYVKTSDPPERRLVVHPHSSHWMHGHSQFPVPKEHCPGCLIQIPTTKWNHMGLTNSSYFTYKNTSFIQKCARSVRG